MCEGCEKGRQRRQMAWWKIKLARAALKAMADWQSKAPWHQSTPAWHFEGRGAGDHPTRRPQADSATPPEAHVSHPRQLIGNTDMSHLRPSWTLGRLALFRHDIMSV